MKSVIITLALLFSGLLSSAQSVISYTYDKQGRLVSEHRESVYRTQFSYDPEGNFISKTVTNYTDISGIAERPGESAGRIYPNPVHDRLTLESTKGEVIRKVRITDMQGRELLLMDCESSRVSLDVKDLPQGIYGLTMQTESGNKTMLIIRQ